MNKFRNKLVSDFRFPFREIDEISIVENYPSEMQNINEHGFIRNDISQILLAQFPTDIDWVLNRISLARKENKFNGMSDKDILLSIKPRLLQSPAEIDNYLSYIDQYMNDIQKDYIVDANDGKIKFDENLNDSSNEES